MKFFTKEEVVAFIAENAPKYPSVHLTASRVFTTRQTDEWCLTIWTDHLCTAVAYNAQQFEAFVMLCFAVVGDVSPREEYSGSTDPEVLQDAHQVRVEKLLSTIAH